MNILGIDIDESSRDEIHVRVDGFLRDDRFHRIATVNPEFLVEADRNPAFRDALSVADFRVADGIGVVLAGLLRGRRIARYPGADLLGYILAKAEQEQLPVFLAVREDGLSSFGEIRGVLLKMFPHLVVGGNEWRMENGEWETYGDRELAIRHSPFAILFCNFGAPEQELFLESFRANPRGVRLAIGVGGAFDFLTGKRTRAPRWMRAMGLEWLWRLIREPRRVGRIWNATAVFLWKIFLGKKKTTRP